MTHPRGRCPIWLQVMCAAILLLLQGTANAATTCTTSTTPLALGAAGPAASQGTATVTITCNSFGLSVLTAVRVRMCLSLDGGAAFPSQLNPRRMRNTFGDTLDYQLFRDEARSLVWGNQASNWRQVDLQYQADVLGGRGSTSVTIYGRIPAQPGAASGIYTAPYAAGNATLLYNAAEGLLLFPPAWPAACTGGASTGFPFNASATVASRCTLSSATDLDFGNVPGAVSSDRDQNSTVTFTCTGRTAWNVGLDNGLHASGPVRRMRRGTSADYVRYELYRDAPRNLRWGTTAGADTASGTGTGTAQSVTVYGRVPAGQVVPAGSYADTITVTVTY